MKVANKSRAVSAAGLSESTDSINARKLRNIPAHAALFSFNVVHNLHSVVSSKWDFSLLSTTSPTTLLKNRRGTRTTPVPSISVPLVPGSTLVPMSPSSPSAWLLPPSAAGR